MGFDIISMKQRAKELMKETKPKPIVIGMVFAGCYLLYEIMTMVIPGNSFFSLSMLVTELVYLNIRCSALLYGMKVTREETTSVSDAFLAYKEKPIQFLLLGVLKDVCYIIGIFCFFVGFFLPFYWFRFSPYIIWDEKVNPFRALSQSMKLMKGHYVELIKLDISNIGWIAVQICTLGIGTFYVRPYLSIVYAEFYDYLKAQNSLFNINN